MANFHYHATDSEQQPVTGELSAESLQHAIDQLEARGLLVRSISHAQSTPENSKGKRLVTDSAVARAVLERTVFGAHLADLLEGAKAISPALRAYSEELPVGRRRDELEAVLAALGESDGAKAEKVFAALPDYWIPLLSAATSSRDPGRVLEGFLSEAERTDELRRQWWLTVSYPLFVLCVAGAVLTLLSVLVVPIFGNIFREFNLEVPLLTQLTLTTASYINHWLPYIVASVVLGAIVFCYFWMRSPRRPSSFANRLPAFCFGKATTIARFSQFLADLLEAGLSVPDTLRVAGFLTTRKGLQTTAWKLADGLQTDTGAALRIHPPRGAATIFHALRSEMPVQSRVLLLREISKVYTDTARRRLSWTRGVVEPATILIVGMVAAVVVVSLFLPLIRLIQGLSS